jgi:osmoprotectant transport system permease protein
VTILGAADTGPSCYSRFVNEWFCWQYVEDRHAQITDALVEHVLITLAALALGLAIALPLALVARRLPRLESAVLGFSTGVYTVPSLALLPLLVPFTGLSAATVVIGLGLYALTILVRALLDGLRSVPDEVREAMAGLRVAAVSTIALTTVGTLVAYGGLGDLIAHGVQRDFRAELMTAAVLCVVLAVLLDVVLVVLQRVLTPWTAGAR